MAADLILIKNPLAPFEREHHTLGDSERPIDWLQRHYPDGCDGSVRFFLNGAERDLDDLDHQPVPGDVIVLAINPADFIIGPSFLAYLLAAAIMTAVSIGLQYLLATNPKPPPFVQNATDAAPSPVYSVRSNQNTARLGEAIPVPYGDVLHTPDVAAQPYRFYSNYTDEYLDMLLCLGSGDFTVNQVLVGDTDSTTPVDNALQYFVATPADHLQQIGNLGSVFSPGPTFYENMLTSSEVAEQEFQNINDEAGYFRMGKSGQVGRYLWVEVFWPAGLFQLTSSNVVNNTHVDFSVYLIEADADGNPIAGTEQTHDFSQGTVSGRDPLRYTFSIDASYVAMWLVRMVRHTDWSPLGGETNRYVWTGLRMLVDPTSTPAPHYGNVTLLCVRFRATSVSSNASNQIRVRLQRNLPLLGSGAPVATNSPADAFVDILTNTDYGARRPLSEVDTARLADLKTFWALGGHNYGFNGIYTGKTTVWEALNDAMQVVAAAPLPLGSLMSVAQDGIKNIRSVMFSEQNMARDTFQLTYSFAREGDNDGIEVEYRNPGTFAPAYIRYPEDCVDPEKIILFGCTDSRQAGEYARLGWQRKLGNRRAVGFETELEGLIPVLGERAAVAHTMPRWGQSGFVVAVDPGLVVTVDRNLLWSEFSAPYMMLFRDPEGGASVMVECTRGDSDDQVILAANPWAGTGGQWSLAHTQERTHFAFGDGAKAVKDFILTALQPRDQNRVAVSGAYYDPSVYVGTFAFLAYPVP